MAMIAVVITVSAQEKKGMKVIPEVRLEPTIWFSGDGIIFEPTVSLGARFELGNFSVFPAYNVGYYEGVNHNMILSVDYVPKKFGGYLYFSKDLGSEYLYSEIGMQYIFSFGKKERFKINPFSGIGRDMIAYPDDPLEFCATLGVNFIFSFKKD